MRKTLTALLAALLLAPGALAQASGVAHVSLDLSAFNGLGAFFLDFQFLDGEGVGDGNAQATVSGLTLTGAASLVPGTQSFLGGASGDPTTLAGLLLPDSDPGGVAAFTQRFVVSGGAQLDFDVAVLASALDGFAPDQFNFLILQGDGVTPLPTQGPGGAELVSLIVDSPTLSAASYGAAPGSPVPLAPPTVNLSGASAPDAPSGGLMLLAGGVALALRRRRAYLGACRPT